jgi:hypothetical protein
MAQSPEPTSTSPDSPRGGGAREPAQIPQPALPRFLVLVGLVLLVQLWLSRHLQLEVKAFLVLTAAVATAATTVLPLLDKPAQHALKKRWLGAVRGIVAFLLKTPVLTAAVLAAVVLGSLCSSVTVATSSPGAPRKVTLKWADGTTLGEQSLESGGTARFFPLWIEPAGTRFLLDVEGCLPHAFEVRPWAGTTIPVEELKPAPTVLVRLPFGWVQNRADGEVFAVEVNGTPIAREPIQVEQGHGAILLGRPSPLPPGVLAGWSAKWRTEVERVKADANIHAGALFAWMHPRVLSSPRSLVPGDQVRVRCLPDRDAPDAEFLAEAAFAVSAEAFQDIEMRGRVADSRPAPAPEEVGR